MARAPKHHWFRFSLRGLFVLVSWTLSAIVFAARLGAQDTGIFVMKVDGSEERKVVQVDGFARHGTPRWSHDGKRLTFDAYQGPNGEGKSFVINVDGSGLKEIGQLGAYDWSPDDKQLVFHSEVGQNLQPGVWVQNIDGNGRDRLTHGAWPRWSPDGSMIAFCDGTAIKVLDLAAGEERVLVDESFVDRPTPFDWSRDGTRLAFITRRAAGQMRELFIIKADGTDGLTPRLARPGFFGGHVTWSADDKQLAFTVDSFIYTLDVEGTGDPQRVGGQSEKSRDPAWSPDGKWIAFARRPPPP